MTALRLASFKTDITPPGGEPIAFGVNRRVDSRIFVRGLVLQKDSVRAVLAAADIIGLHGSVYRVWRRAIAFAAGCPEKNVLLHCVHQHDSILPPSKTRLRLGAKLNLGPQPSVAYYSRILSNIGAAVRQAVRGRWRKVSRIATSERRVAGLASNRRLVGPDGKIFAMRWSMTSNLELQRKPVGQIDPFLRTVGFLSENERVLAALHYYATHPMGAYGRNMASADIPGVALSYAEKTRRGTAQLYFTGCAGDVTFGKYTFASKSKNLRVLGARLGRALAENLLALRGKNHSAISLRLTRASFDLPLDRARINAAAMEKRLRAAKERGAAHFPIRMLELLRGWERWRRVELTRLDLGPDLHILSFPAETVVAYQLFAQELAPEHFIAIAGYAEGIYGYLPTARMFSEGGHEAHGGPSTPELEARYKAAIETLLADLR